LRLAFSTLGCPEWSLEQVVDAAVRYGYEAVEVRGLREHVDLRQSLPFQPQQRARTRGLFEDAGIAVCCLGTSASFADPQKRDASKEEARAYAEIAADLGCPMVRVFGGTPPAGQSSEETAQAVADSLAELAPFAQVCGVTLVLETHDSFSTGARVNDVLSRVNHPAVGALWDMHHPYRGGEAPAHTLDALGPFLRHAHVKDSRDGHYCLLGEGDVPVREMLGMLLANGSLSLPYLSLEWEKRWHPEIAQPEVAFPQYADTLRNYLTSYNQ
jgi:sugar phosphate isomerase/epimerase